MSDDYKSVLEAVRQLQPEQQQLLAMELANLLSLRIQAMAQAQMEESEKQSNLSKSTASSPEGLRWLLAEIMTGESERSRSQEVAEHGKARRHFGAWDSGDERSADNDRIDLDLAREYGSSR